MEAIFNDPLALIVVILVGIIGIFIGFLIARGAPVAKIEKAFEEGKREGRTSAEREFEETRENLSVELASSLTQMRSGLIQTIQSYQSALNTLEEKLPLEADMKRQLDAPLETKRSDERLGSKNVAEKKSASTSSDDKKSSDVNNSVTGSGPKNGTTQSEASKSEALKAKADAPKKGTNESGAKSSAATASSGTASTSSAKASTGSSTKPSASSQNGGARVVH